MGTPMPSIWVANQAGAQKIPNNPHQMVLFHQKPKKSCKIKFKDAICAQKCYLALTNTRKGNSTYIDVEFNLYFMYIKQ